MSRAEETMPFAQPGQPQVWQTWWQDVDRELTRLRRICMFLFALILFSIVVLSIWFASNANRIEYERYDLCKTRQAEVIAYNQQNYGLVPPFPVASCGVDPRTD